MSRRCREIQELLAEYGPAVLRDRSEAQEHVTECADCFRLLEAFGELDHALAALPALDAPEHVVESVLERTAEPPPAPAEPERPRRTWLTSARGVRHGSIAAASVAAALLAVVLLGRSLMFPAAVVERQHRIEVAKQELGQKDQPRSQPGLESFGYVDRNDDELVELESPADERGEHAASPAEARAAAPLVAKLKARKDNVRERAAGSSGEVAMFELNRRLAESKNSRRNELYQYFGGAPGKRAYRPQPSRTPELKGADLSTVVASGAREKQPATPDAPVGPAQLEPEARPSRSGREGLADGEVGGFANLVLEEDFDGTDVPPAEAFWNERRSLEDVSFQPSAGYWANTYVPGDPLLRWLVARVAARSAGVSGAGEAQPVRLEAGARPTTQPFDPPVNAALAVFLHADRAGIEGASRMLVQVGLQGAVRHSGLRPGMNVAVVLDARGTPSGEDAAAMRALMDALLAAREAGDRFHMILAGRPQGAAVGAENFRHGPLRVALLDLVEPGAATSSSEPALGLAEALQWAVDTLAERDDPTAPLGSSLVLLATAQPLGAEAKALEAIAHQSAVAGIPVSVAGIGERVVPGELERVALAGQGNRRLLELPADAERVVERELSAQGRVIARAVRLRIRLAPGVKLIEVVGSERLDAAGATRVRQAERSIDQRLSRNLGIERDRGEDEEGIQIVIPTFYAGDAHVVLLDVVAPDPGPVADVTLRFKDLVYLRNGVVRANLTLPLRVAAPGPLERNVVKNLLAIRLAERLEIASEALLAGRDAVAIEILDDYRALLRGIAEAPEYGRDPDLRADLVLLDEYLAALERPDAVPREYLAESLQLSSYFKTVPRQTAD